MTTQQTPRDVIAGLVAFVDEQEVKRATAQALADQYRALADRLRSELDEARSVIAALTIERDAMQHRLGESHQAIMVMEEEAKALLSHIGAETPIAAFDLATTWRSEKAGYMEQIARANRTLADMVNQYMSSGEGYITHEFMSAQEEAIDYLETIGWLRAGALERYYWTDLAMEATRND